MTSPRTKIVATIGPATLGLATIGDLVEAGMDVARLNASHNTLYWHAGVISRLRQEAPHVPILVDCPGTKIRTSVQPGVPWFFNTGDEVILTSGACSGTSWVQVDCPDFGSRVRAGDDLMIDDGTIRLTVLDIDGDIVRTLAKCPGAIGSRKGIVIPRGRVSGPSLTDRDIEVLMFALDNEVDFVGISFVEAKFQVEDVRRLVGPTGPAIVAKIETSLGVANAEAIIQAADAVMIDRGDLASDVGFARVALIQKQVLALAHQHSTPSIVATEMLHSMISSPTPTKAEVSDVTNAVLDSCQATMLSGETAVGTYPLEAIRVMREIAQPASDHRRTQWDPEYANAAILLARQVKASKIVAITMSGYAARAIAACLPAMPIIAATCGRDTARRANLLAGVTGVHVDVPFTRTSTDHIPACLRALYDKKLIVADDVIVVAAVAYPGSGSLMNMIQVHSVSDLVKVLGW